mgnify:CR=1 FL=1
MNLNNAERASILVQALPYIQKYAGKTIVIKYGGNAMINEELKQAVMGDIVLLSPACASFDAFKNYKERGMTFRSIIEQF